MEGLLKKMMLVMAGLAICAATAQASDFETALKNELLANHQRHIPEVSVSGNEVTLTYGPEEQWSKSTAHDEVAKMDALDCLKARLCGVEDHTWPPSARLFPRHQLQFVVSPNYRRGDSEALRLSKRESSGCRDCSNVGAVARESLESNSLGGKLS